MVRSKYDLFNLVQTVLFITYILTALPCLEEMSSLSEIQTGRYLLKHTLKPDRFDIEDKLHKKD